LSEPFEDAPEKDGQTHEVHSDIVVSTISNAELIKAVYPARLVESFFRYENDFVSRSFRMGVFVVKGFVLPARVVIFPENKYMFNRLSAMNLFSDLGYRPGETVLLADVICDEASLSDRLDSQTFADKLLKSLLELGWFSQGDVLKSFSVRVPKAYPVLSAKRCMAQSALDNGFRGTNIFLCGREASSDYNNAHNAMGKAFSPIGLQQCA
jgi:hypothetical protein